MTAYYMLATVMFLLFFGGGTTIPLFPLYAQSLGASLVEISWMAGGNSMVTLIANLVWGRVSDRLGRRKPVLIAAMATLTTTSIIASLAGAWWTLLPLRLIEGAAFGAYAVASLAMLGDILESNPHRARLVGVARMSGSLAFSIAVISAGLVSQQFGLPATYRVAAVIYIIALLFAIAMPESRPVARPAGPRSQVSFGELLRGPMLPLLALAASFNIPFSAGFFSVWPIWVSETLGLGRATFSQLWGLASFVEVPCLAIAGFLADRFGRRFTFMLGMIVFAGTYALYLLVATVGGIPTALLPSFLGGAEGASGYSAVPVLVLAQLLRGFGFAAFTATALTMAIEVSPPHARGRAAGLYSMAESLANIGGNYIGGPIAQAFGNATLFAGACCAVLLGAGYVRVAVAHPKDDPAARLERSAGV